MKLNAENIDSAIEQIASFLRDNGVDGRQVIRTQLALDEAMLRFRDEFGEDHEFDLNFHKRFGTLNVKISVPGHSVDVLTAEAEDGFDLGSSFFSSLLGDDFGTLTYSYRDGMNNVSFTMRVIRERPFWADPLLCATLAAVIAFFAFRNLAPGFGQSLLEGFVSPVLATLMGILSAITGPLLSLSLISGVTALGNTATFKTTGARAIRRIMLWVVAMFVVSVAVCGLFYGIGGEGTASFDGNELFELLLAAIPSNLFAPFLENNALQITVVSLFVGVCLLALEGRSDRIRELIGELNSLVFKMMFLFSKALPVLVGFSVFKALMTTDISQLSTIGDLLLTNYIVTFIFSLAIPLWIYMRLKVSPIHFVKKCWPALFIAFTTGSSTTAMAENFRVCEKNLGVKKRVVDFWLPLGQVMFAPSVVIPLTTGMFVIANMEGQSFSWSRILVLFILVFQLSMASPKVPGGIAATFAILLGQLGLSLDSVGVLMAANVFILNYATAFGILVRDAEICAFAEGEGALNHEILEAP